MKLLALTTWDASTSGKRLTSRKNGANAVQLGTNVNGKAIDGEE